MNPPAASAQSQGQSILTINGGSSSIKFALFKLDNPHTCCASGKIERIGLPEARFKATKAGKEPEVLQIQANDHKEAGSFLVDWLEKQNGLSDVQGIGHRIVHGGNRFSAPQKVTPEMLTELQRLKPFDPEHLPSEIDLIELFAHRYPKLTQVACFDTAFHRNMPRVARLLPLPRRFDAKGIRRFGFHGLSYEFLMEELIRIAGPEAAQSRVIFAHLGNGASLAAVLNGKGIDTSMSFTPTAGVPMSSRSGDLDPGLVWYFEREEQISGEKFHHMVNHESGLLGVSETSSDMRDLLAKEAEDVRAAEAVALFCYQIKKWIGAFAAALGGVDTIVFSGGIGENAAVVRSRICSGLDFLGIRINEERNDANAPVISSDDSRVSVRVIRTNEELMIAKSVAKVLEENSKSELRSPKEIRNSKSAR